MHMLDVSLSDRATSIAVALLSGLVAYLCWRRFSRPRREARRRFVAVSAPSVDGKKRERLRLPVQRWVRVGAFDSGGSVLLLTYGTRGDVEPLVALAERLQILGLRPRLCAPTCYRGLVEGAGVAFESIGVESVDQPAEIFARGVGSIADVLGVLAKVYPQLAAGSLRAASQGETNAIVCTALTRSIALHIAEKLRLPCFCAHFVASDVSTRAFPPCEYIPISKRAARTLPAFLHGRFNKAMYSWRGLQIIRAALSTGLAAADTAFRTKEVGLPPADPLQSMADVDMQPAFHAYSEKLQPRPADWPANVMICGFWRRSNSQDKVPSELAAVLQAKSLDRLVLVTFGSMDIPDALRQKVVDVALAEGCRVIMCAPGDPDAPDVEEIGPKLWRVRTSIPYAQVFPRCACIVHHGGAGTSAAALYAGTPSLVVPILRWSDQPYWATRIEAVGCGVHAPRELAEAESGDQLQRALRRALHSSTRAQAVGKRLKSSVDGVAISAAIFKQYCEELS